MRIFYSNTYIHQGKAEGAKKLEIVLISSSLYGTQKGSVDTGSMTQAPEKLPLATHHASWNQTDPLQCPLLMMSQKMIMSALYRMLITHANPLPLPQLPHHPYLHHVPTLLHFLHLLHPLLLHHHHRFLTSPQPGDCMIDHVSKYPGV